MKLFDFSNVDDLSKLSSNFIGFVSIENYKSSIKIINEWAEGLVDRDNKFVNEFQTTFNSSFWEIYCFAVIKKLGLTCDFTLHAPDFVVFNKYKDSQKYKFAIECTIAAEAKDGLREYNFYEKNYPTKSVDECLFDSTLRLSNSFKSKADKFKKSYSKNCELAEIPFIIAIAPFDQPNAQVSNQQAINRVLFGTEHTRNKNKVFVKKFNKIRNKNDSVINLGYFNDNSFEYVTAVLFSNVATSGKVVAMSSEPDVGFFHKRYTNANSTRPEIAIDYRINYRDREKSLVLKHNTIKDFKDKFICEETADHTTRNPFCGGKYSEELCDGLHLYINPNAKNKLSKTDIELFVKAGICVWEYDVNLNILVPSSNLEGTLQFRKFLFANKKTINNIYTNRLEHVIKMRNIDEQEDYYFNNF